MPRSRCWGGSLAAITTAVATIKQEAQYNGLEANVVMGGDRALEPANWDSQTHQQMWDGVHNHNDPSSAAAQSDAWVQVGNALATLGGSLHSVSETASNRWRGQGGSAAASAVLGLAQWGSQSAQAAQYLGHGLTNQTSGATAAKNAMPEPDNYDPQQVFTQSYTSSMRHTRNLYKANPTDNGTVTQPTGADGLQAASSANAAVAARAEQSEAKRQQAIQVMKTYETTSTGVDESTPVFAPPPDEVNGGSGSGSSYSGTPVSVHSASYVAPTGSTHGPTGGGGPTSVGTTGGSGGGFSTTGSPTPGFGSGPSGGAASNGSGAFSATGGGIGGVGAGGGRALESGRTVSAFGSGTPSSGAGGFGGTGGAGAGGLAGGAGRPGGGLAGAPVPLGGGRDGETARSNKAYGPGVSYKGGSGGTGLAGRSGMDPGAGRASGAGGVAGEGSGPRGAAGAGEATAGRAGAAGASGAGGQGKGEKGEEDGEHETPAYLKTVDLFGTTQVVAPAVIGD